MSGIFGVYSVENKNIALDLFHGSIGLQHRGEEGSGLSIIHKNGFYTPEPQPGLFYYNFRDILPELIKLNPFAGIGHVLYEQGGNLQPQEQWQENYSISMAMDGVLLGFEGKHDSVMRTLFVNSLEETKNFYAAAEIVMKKLSGRGQYNVVTLVESRGDTFLVAYRDPKGIKPLCFGKKDKTYFVASESKALDGIDAEFERDVLPGEVLIISRKGIESKVVVKDPAGHAHCAFEWVYFADPVSVIEGKNVYMVRKSLGTKLARRYPLEVDLVMASPDSGRGVAIGFHQELSRIKNKFIPFEEASIKNPGAKRTFQVENPEERKLAVVTKFFMNAEVVKNKRVAVGDDSIVRGIVFRDGMVYKLKKAGAKEIIPVISCPPLRYACAKDPEGKTFAAQGLSGSVEEIGREVAKKLGVERVCYPTIEELDECIGCKDTCKACFNGVYPLNDEFIPK